MLIMTVVGQSVWSRHCYWLSCLTYGTRPTNWTYIRACTKGSKGRRTPL